MRTSLGASRLRLVRQLLIEACLLAAAGGIVGLAVGVGRCTPSDGRFLPTRLPYWFDYSVDARLVLALAAVSAATVLVFGLVSAFSASKLTSLRF